MPPSPPPDRQSEAGVTVAEARQLDVASSAPALAALAGAARPAVSNRHRSVADASPRRRGLPTGLGRLLGPLLVLGLWQLLSSTGVFDPTTISSPSQVFNAGRELVANGQLSSNLWISLYRAMAGLAIGVVLGTVIGVLVALSRIAEHVFDGPMQMMRTTPITALIPLFVVWFGIGEEAKIAMVAVATIFPIYLNLVGGIRGADLRLIEAARAYGLSGWSLVRQVILPAALPSFLVGLRYSTGLAWVVLVISEQINATSGIGYLMINAEQYFRTDVILVGIVIYSLLGLISDQLVRLIERRALSWRPSLEDG